MIGKARVQLLAICLSTLSYAGSLSSQVLDGHAGAPLSRISSLDLPPAEAVALKQALDRQQYIQAEELLLAALQKDPQSARAARLLNFVGAIYFLKQDYFNAAVAWKKAETISPLESSVQFSLAMAYIELGHNDWALQQLNSLAMEGKREAIYPYWIGRLLYDAHQYDRAIASYHQALLLEPKMAKAYDGLGLCYFYKNQNEDAIQAYEQAIALEKSDSGASAWIHVDFAEALHFVNRDKQAEAELRTAIRLRPRLTQAHFELGVLLHERGDVEEAISELQTAAALDPLYAEPHFLLARVYRGLGRTADAKAEVEEYHRVHDHAGPKSKARIDDQP